MPDRVTIVSVTGAIIGLVIVLELVRRRKLREDYSLLWLATAAVLIILSLWRSLLDWLAGVIGVITYPPAALFAVAIGFMLLILLHFSTVLTKLSRENKQIAQEVALLRYELARTRAGEIAGSSDNDHQSAGVE